MLAARCSSLAAHSGDRSSVTDRDAAFSRQTGRGGDFARGSPGTFSFQTFAVIRRMSKARTFIKESTAIASFEWESGGSILLKATDLALIRTAVIVFCRVESQRGAQAARCLPSGDCDDCGTIEGDDGGRLRKGPLLGVGTRTVLGDTQLSAKQFSDSASLRSRCREDSR